MIMITTSQAETILGALADAAAFRRRKAEEHCHDCDEARGGPYCIVHRAAAAAAQEYEDLAAVVRGTAVPRTSQRDDQR